MSCQDTCDLIWRLSSVTIMTFIAAGTGRSRTEDNDLLQQAQEGRKVSYIAAFHEFDSLLDITMMGEILIL